METLRRVVRSNGAADCHDSSLLHPGKHHVQNLASHVVKVDVDVAGGRGLEIFPEGRRLVVEAFVGSDGLDPGTLAVTACDADDLFAADELLCNLLEVSAFQKMLRVTR